MRCPDVGPCDDTVAERDRDTEIDPGQAVDLPHLRAAGDVGRHRDEQGHVDDGDTPQDPGRRRRTSQAVADGQTGGEDQPEAHLAGDDRDENR
jgi:hypothetical protein